MASIRQFKDRNFHVWATVWQKSIIVDGYYLESYKITILAMISQNLNYTTNHQEICMVTYTLTLATSNPLNFQICEITGGILQKMSLYRGKYSFTGLLYLSKDYKYLNQIR